jgi:hypothetical protein
MTFDIALPHSVTPVFQSLPMNCAPYTRVPWEFGVEVGRRRERDRGKKVGRGEMKEAIKITQHFV